MRKSIIVLVGCLFSMCDTPKVVFTDNLCKSVFKHTENNFIDILNAEEAYYSVVIFTTVFEGEKITLLNNQEVLYNDFIKDIGNGFSKAIRIDNRFDVIIEDEEKEYTFTLKKEHLRHHKYIYIQKNILKKKRPYHIIYSNTLCGFK